MSFSSDDSVLLTGKTDGSVGIWDLRHGTEITSLKSGSQIITGVAFTRGGRTIVTASLDDRVRFWSVASLASPPSTITVPGQSLTNLAVSPDGSMIATEAITAATKGNGTPDFTAVRLWYTNPAKVAQGICQTLRGYVPRATWIRYGLAQYAYTPICR